MPLTREAAARALRLLQQLAEDGGSDSNLATAASELGAVMDSSLFAALLELQQYMQGIPAPEPKPEPKDASASSKARTQGRPSHKHRHASGTVDLEWEHQYDVGSIGSGSQSGDAILREWLEEIVVPLPAPPHGKNVSLGITINGGTDASHFAEDSSIYITAIIPAGVADVDGRLRVGDRILSVNGEPLETVTHSEAVAALRRATEGTTPKVQLVVLHNAMQRKRATLQRQTSAVLQSHIKQLSLQKGPSGFGFTVAGGRGTPHISGDEGAFVAKLQPGGVAEQSGKLSVGDRLLQVNGKSSQGLTHDGVVDLLRQAGERVDLLVEHNAYARALEEAARALGIRDPPQPRFSRTGTLEALKLSPPESGPDHPLKLSQPAPPRDVELHKGNTGYGFNFIGPISSGPPQPGEPVGIFISKVDPNGAAALSGDVFEGDQILTLNGHDLTSASYPQAATLFRQYARDSTMTLRLQRNPDMYSMFRQRAAAVQQQLHKDRAAAVAKQAHSGADKRGKKKKSKSKPMYLRALFRYNPSEDNTLSTKEKRKVLLSFDIHEVFFVEVVPSADWWTAQSVDGAKAGLIPSVARWDRSFNAIHGQGDGETEAEGQGSPGKGKGKGKRSKGGKDSAHHKGSHGRKRTFSFRFARRLSFRKRSASTTSLTSESSESGLRMVSYEIVELREQKAEEVRPLLILGPSKDTVTDRLVIDFPDVFGACVPHTTRAPRAGEVDGEDYFFIDREEMLEQVSDGKFVEVGQYNGNLYGTSFDAVRAVAAEGRTCILDVTAHAISKLRKGNIHPIVVFLKPMSVEVIQHQSTGLELDECVRMFETAVQLERRFAHLFSRVILNGDEDKTYQQVVETVRQQSREPFWAPTGDRLSDVTA